MTSKVEKSVTLASIDCDLVIQCDFLLMNHYRLGHLAVFVDTYLCLKNLLNETLKSHCLMTFRT